MIYIKNANLYTPEAVGLRNILIAGGKIVAIDSEEFSFADNIQIETVDLQGARVTPGFIDAHAHVTGGGGEVGFATQVPPVPISDFTAAGVTTVVGLLGTDDTTRNIENLVARTYALREEGMSAYCWTGGYHYPLTTLLGSAKRDIVFLDPVIGIGEFAISDHRSSQPTFNEVVRLASEAHVAGLMTKKAGVMHFHLGDGDRKLELIERALKETEIPARTFNPTHVNRNKPLFASACELLKQGCYIDITAFPEGMSANGWEAAQAVAIAIEQGLPTERITLSSDGGGCLPDFDRFGNLLSMDFGRAQTLIETVIAAEKLSVSLQQILPMLTSNVAQLLRLTNKGQIAKGFDADLIVLDQHLQISDVMALGVWHKRQGKVIIKGTFE
ncbi:MAG: beta-aspartyl-peptidase [Pseudomonadales bacterium]|nr:beta-aspartyl-peptidase [Pseudomonadales bacterium]NRA17783.1 beta-aspartyl-peptidase [Oceanospirillaceae bacterium]